MTTTTAPPTEAVPNPPVERSQRLLEFCVVAAIVIGLVLRFVATSPLWLDEAQTVVIASHPLSSMFSALKVDGSPPLFYLLLHFWMRLFGTSSFAVRALPGIFSVAAVALAPLTARRIGLSRSAGLTFTLLVATSPFAVAYATEARMYSLVMLLVMLLVISVERVWSNASFSGILAAAVVTAALLLTHYWSLFFYGSAFVVSLELLRRGHPKAKRLLTTLLLALVPFIPWAPTFVFQTLHTGAPWGTPPSIGVAFKAPSEWTGAGSAGTLLAAAFYVLIVVAVAGRIVSADGGIGLRFGRPRQPVVLVLAGISLLGMLIGCVVGAVLGSAYAIRYSMPALVPMLLVIALGVEALPQQWRSRTVAGLSVLGLIGISGLPAHQRTQARAVATILSQQATADDVVIFCPDQLGPAVHRLVPNAGRQVVYPDFRSPRMINWVGYASRINNSHPALVAKRVEALAAGHKIFMVYATDYPLFTSDCSELLTDIAAADGVPRDAISENSDLIEHENLAIFGSGAS